MTEVAAWTRRPGSLGVAMSAALGLLVVLVARWGPDWPAQEFRAWTAAHDGLVSWTSQWYGGEALPGYSVLYPLFAVVFGAGLTGLLAVVITTWTVSSLAPAGHVRARWFVVAVGLGLIENLLIGQVPFLLGVMFAVVALRCIAQAGRPWVIGLAACACALASPLAGASLLIGQALVVGFGLRRCAWLSTALIGIGFSVVVGGAAGPYPLQWQSMAAITAFSIGTMVLTLTANRALRCFGATYLLVALVLVLEPNPIGGNVARIGKLIALPLMVRFVVVPPGWLKRAMVTLAAMAAAAWPTAAFTSSIVRGADDPSSARELLHRSAELFEG